MLFSATLGDHKGVRWTSIKEPGGSPSTASSSSSSFSLYENDNEVHGNIYFQFKHNQNFLINIWFFP
jgi:hypothetical protein